MKRAEVALADGRFDEAFEIVRAEDVRAHRRGQELLGKLARALAERGKEHLAADRLEQAQADCEKGMIAAGNLPELAELCAAIAHARQEKQHRERLHADALAAARDHIRQGQLSLGEAALADAAVGSARVADLRGEVAARRVAVEKAVAKVNAALAAGDWAVAVDGLNDARRAQVRNPELEALEVQAGRLAAEKLAEAVDSGRLDVAEVMVGRLGPALSEQVELAPLIRVVEGCRAALDLLGGEPRRAVEVLRRLSALRPGAAWLAEAVVQATQACEALEGLRSGPLGLLMPLGLEGHERTRTVAARERAMPPAPVMPQVEVKPEAAVVDAPGGRVPARLMLLVDGAGSYLVLRDRRVSLGPISSSRRPDVGLLAEAGLPTVTIERVEEDYFVASSSPVLVNDSPTTRKLLINGDCIALSPRCRLKFALPNPASTTAILTLSGTRLPGSDARQIVLMDRAVVLGPGPSAHIRTEGLTEQAILQVRDDRLTCATREPVVVEGKRVARGEGIGIGARVKVGGVGVVVKVV